MTALPSTRMRTAEKAETVLRNIAIVLSLLWVIGLVTSHTFGGWIHLMLAAAAILFLVRLIRRENQRASP